MLDLWRLWWTTASFSYHQAAISQRTQICHFINTRPLGNIVILHSFSLIPDSASSSMQIWAIKFYWCCASLPEMRICAKQAAYLRQSQLDYCNILKEWEVKAWSSNAICTQILFSATMVTSHWANIYSTEPNSSSNATFHLLLSRSLGDFSIAAVQYIFPDWTSTVHKTHSETVAFQEDITIKFWNLPSFFGPFL